MLTASSTTRCCTANIHENSAAQVDRQGTQPSRHAPLCTSNKVVLAIPAVWIRLRCQSHPQASPSTEIRCSSSFPPQKLTQKANQRHYIHTVESIAPSTTRGIHLTLCLEMHCRHLMQVNPARPLHSLGPLYSLFFCSPSFLQSRLLTIGVCQSRQNGDQWELSPCIHTFIAPALST